MSDYVALDDLLNDLIAAVRAGESGAFFITTDNQHSAMVTVAEGALTGIQYRQQRGHAAAEALSQVQRLKYRAADAPTRIPGTESIDTETALAILSGSVDRGVPAAGAEASEALDALRQRYIAVVGPIGGALFDETLETLSEPASTPPGMQELVSRLSQDIDDAQEAARFRRESGIAEQ